MKKTVYLLAASTIFSVLAFAENWSGKLIDATCNDQKEQTKAMSCDATSTTTSFAIDVAGKIYKLDSAGNTKAASALRSRADRSTDPAKPMTGAVTAKVSGTEKDGVISAESVEVQ
jgi:hypothetical protein